MPGAPVSIMRRAEKQSAQHKNHEQPDDGYQQGFHEPRLGVIALCLSSVTLWQRDVQPSPGNERFLEGDFGDRLAVGQMH